MISRVYVLLTVFSILALVSAQQQQLKVEMKRFENANAILCRSFFNKTFEPSSGYFQLSSSFTGMALVTYGSTVYVVGGDASGVDYTNLVSALDFSSNSLSTLSNANVYLVDHGVTIHNGTLVVAGGRSPLGYSPSQYVTFYDLKTGDTLKASTYLGVPRLDVSAGTVGEISLFVGGAQQQQGGYLQNDYSQDIYNWETATFDYKARGAPTAKSLEFIGSSSTKAYFWDGSNFYIYNSQALLDPWSLYLPNTPSISDVFKLNETSIVLIATSSVVLFELDSNVETELAARPFGQKGTVGGASGNKIFILTKGSSEINVYDMVSGAWNIITDSNFKIGLFSARITSNNRFIMTGGESSEDPSTSGTFYMLMDPALGYECPKGFDFVISVATSVSCNTFSVIVLALLAVVS